MDVHDFIWPTLGKGLTTHAHSPSTDLEWSAAKFTFGTRGSQLPLLRTCGGAL
jgi:hypothetical protein